MNLKTLINLAAFALAGTALFFSLQTPNAPDKIAYVRSADLLHEYEGMVEARQRYQQDESKAQAELARLEALLKAQFNDLQEDAIKTDAVALQNAEARFRFLQQEYEASLKDVQAQLTEKDNELTQGVLNQVNSFITDYGKQNGYQVILGTTTDGNLLYAEEAIDITGEVLTALNAQYQGS